LDASVDEYLNPAPVTAGESPPAGEHFVAVSILLFNHAKPNTSTDVNPVSGVTVLDGTGKKSYSAVTRVNLTGSRALIAAGSHTLGAGEKLSGWVVVAVPNNAGIAAVRFAPKGIYSIQGVWLVCDLAHTQGCALPGNSGPSS